MEVFVNLSSCRLVELMSRGQMSLSPENGDTVMVFFSWYCGKLSLMPPSTYRWKRERDIFQTNYDQNVKFSPEIQVNVLPRCHNSIKRTASYGCWQSHAHRNHLGCLFGTQTANADMQTYSNPCLHTHTLTHSLARAQRELQESPTWTACCATCQLCQHWLMDTRSVQLIWDHVLAE